MIKNERIVYSYGYLRNISYLSYKEAEEKEEGRFNNCLVSMVFSALSLEAYMNYVGEIKVKSWKSISRGRIKDKIIAITKALNCKVDFGERPFQTFKEMFNYRNKLAHAETEYLSSDKVKLRKDGKPETLLTKWEEKTNLKEAKLFLDNTKEMMEILHREAGLGELFLGVMSEHTQVY